MRRAVHLPAATDDTWPPQAVLVVGTALGIPNTLWWGLAYVLLGKPVGGLVVLGYSLASVANLVGLVLTGRFRVFCLVQLVLLLTTPFLAQWGLGGALAGGPQSLWALLAPLGALVAYGPRGSLRWFVAFLLLLVISALLEPWLPDGGRDWSERTRLLFTTLDIVGVSAFAFLLLRYFVRERDRAATALARALRLLREEQDRSERLLLNVLPAPIAERLKRDASAIADRYDEATVMFADVVDFTPLAARLAPEDLIRFLNRLFSTFDRLAEHFGLEKVKTVGDAYMVVGGVPVPRADHAEAIAELALAMQEAVAAFEPVHGDRLRLRIGIHTGPLIAGVIGLNKFAYDLWGDTVNIASRMQSQGVADGIQITAATYDRLRHRYRCEWRGQVEAKGKGLILAYLLLGPLHPGAPGESEPPRGRALTA
jgi:class 3 adenylate cyclase